MIHASLENCTIWVCLKMWYPQVQRMKKIINVNLPFWSAHRYSPCFINMFQWIDLKGTCPGTPDIWLVKPCETNQILSRAFDAHFAQARRTPPVCGHWAVLTQQQKDPAKHLQNICQAALILAPCHTVWAIMSSHMWTYCKTHGIKTCSQLEDLKNSKEFHHASLQEICYSPGLCRRWGALQRPLKYTKMLPANPQRW